MKKQQLIAQKGSFVIEALLVLLVLGAIGGTILASRQTRKPQPAKSSNVTAVSAEYAGWNTYTSRDEGLTFKYPSDWRIEVSSDGLYDVATLSAPSGLTLRYMSNVSGLGGACLPPECPDVATYKLEKIANTKAVTDLYYVEGSVKSNFSGDKLKNLLTPRMGVISKTEGAELPKVGEQLDKYPYYIFAEKRKKPADEFKSHLFGLYFETHPNQGSDGSKWAFGSEAELQKFFQSKDAQTAKSIIKSVRY